MRPSLQKVLFTFATGVVSVLLCLGMPADERSDSRVEMRGGVPTFFVNGRPHSGVCYSSYDCDPANLARRVRHFADAGCDMFNFVVEVSGYGFSRPMWVGEDQWDFSELDQRAGTILAAAPSGMLILRIYIDAPAWWREKNPDEMVVLSNGSTSFGEKLFALPRASDFPSIASKKWRADIAYALEKVIGHIEESDYGKRVIGYQLSGQKTEEWYHWSMNTELLGDYSPHMTRAFRDWLRGHYESDDKFQKAWGSQGVAIGSAEIPSQKERFGDRSKTFRDLTRERNVIDFHVFWSEIMADTISYFAKTVKDTTSRRKIVGAFYGYTFEFAELGEDAGHLSLGRLLRCPDIDFIMAPSSYYDRNLPGKPFFRAPVASLNLHGKVFWNDFDQVSFKYYEKLKEAPGLKQWEYQMGLTKTADEFVWMNRREVGMALAQGAQLAHFDIHGGYYEDPVVMDGVKGLIEIRNQALPLDSRASIAEILVIVDEESQHYVTFRNPITKTLLAAQLANVGFVSPYDAVLLQDLADLDTTRFKLVLVLNAVKLDGDQRRVIKGKVARDGKTVVWLHAPGYIDSNGIRPQNMFEVTGINIVPDASAPTQGVARLSAHIVEVEQEVSLIPGDQFRVVDEDATPLARQADESKSIVMALKRFADWVSVYSAAAPLSPLVLRRLANEAGVHLYTNDPDYLVFANKHYLALGAPTDTETCEVTLPEKRTVTDLTTGKIICRGSKVFSVNLHPKEVRIFFMD